MSVNTNTQFAGLPLRLTDSGEKHQVADDAIFEALVFHRRASILDHDGLTREALEVRERLGEHRDALKIVEFAAVPGGGAGNDGDASGRVR